MPSIQSAVATLTVAVPLAILFLLSLPTGVFANILVHAVLLVGGTAVVLALQETNETE